MPFLLKLVAALGCGLMAIASLANLARPGNIFLLIGSVTYLIGTILVTIAFNVPLNNALAIANPDSTESANLWARYLTNWTLWNHIRTITSLGAAVLLTIALTK